MLFADTNAQSLRLDRSTDSKFTAIANLSPAFKPTFSSKISRQIWKHCVSRRSWFNLPPLYTRVISSKSNILWVRSEERAWKECFD